MTDALVDRDLASNAASASLIAVVGATGTGKTDFSLDLAQRISDSGREVELVNADAMQLYRGMNIGTAKLDVAGRRGFTHHLLDVLDPSEEANAAHYQTAARTIIDDILERGAVPILVGGSGLYVSSVLFDFEFPGTDAAVRSRLEAELAELGPGALHARLAAVDPDAALGIGPHNGRRLVRALEVIDITGKPFGAGLPDDQATWRPVTIYGLTVPRDELVIRLDARVERMWRIGLVDEVRKLRDSGVRFGVTAARAIGYAQALAQLAGELTEREAIEQAQSLTRKYARRQVSWFQRYKSAQWVTQEPTAETAVGAGVAGEIRNDLPS